MILFFNRNPFLYGVQALPSTPSGRYKVSVLVLPD